MSTPCRVRGCLLLHTAPCQRVSASPRRPASEGVCLSAPPRVRGRLLVSAARQVQRLHRSTLQLKLDVLHLAKLLPHQLALTMPTSRQMASGHILARRLGSPVWTKTGWKEWVAESRDRISQRQLKLSAHRLEEAALAKSIPAAYKRPASSGRKRTPFTLERARGVQRAGVHLRRPAAKRQRTQSDVDE